MQKVNIKIIQGIKDLEYADVNIVIDVIRAFSVSHQAFIGGVESVYLTNSEEEALVMKEADPTLLLSGEVDGYKIKSFDVGNSPYDIKQMDLRARRMLQKTTNGVRATLHSWNCSKLFVTGYSNAYVLARHIRTLMKEESIETINIIASHATSDEDLACAEYIEKIILDDITQTTKDFEEIIVHRIFSSQAAKKFIERKPIDFPLLDLVLCSIREDTNFVMQVTQENSTIQLNKVITKELLC
jgi:2-phosphosulfolactate phosphatase